MKGKVHSWPIRSVFSICFSVCWCITQHSHCMPHLFWRLIRSLCIYDANVPLPCLITQGYPVLSFLSMLRVNACCCCPFVIDSSIESHDPGITFHRRQVMSMSTPDEWNPNGCLFEGYNFSSQLLLFGGTTMMNQPGFIDPGVTLAWKGSSSVDGSVTDTCSM